LARRSLEQGEERALVARAREGDTGAMNELVSAYHAVVFRIGFRILGDEDRAADVAQSSFIRAFRALGALRDDGAFRSWLLTIARNEAYASLRRNDRNGEVGLEAAIALPDGSPLPDREIIEEEERGRVKDILLALPEKQRKAVFLRVFEELSFREIGRLIGSSEGAARVNYHNGICRLRKTLV